MRILRFLINSMPSAPFKRNIGEGDVGFQRLHGFERFVDIFRGAANGQIRLAVDQLRETFAHNRMVVDDKDRALALHGKFSLSSQITLFYSLPFRGSTQVTIVPPFGFF